MSFTISSSAVAAKYGDKNTKKVSTALSAKPDIIEGGGVGDIVLGVLSMNPAKVGRGIASARGKDLDEGTKKALGWISKTQGVDIGRGFFGAAEGITDFLAGGAAQLVGQKDAAKWIYEHSWSQDATGADVTDEFIGDAAETKGYRLASDLLSGIGNVGFQIAVGTLIGGALAAPVSEGTISAAGAKAIQYAPLFVSASGSGTAENMQKTGELGWRENVGGLLKGGVEVLTEIASPTGRIANAALFGKSAKGMSRYLVKHAIAKNIIVNFAEEAGEEAASYVGDYYIEKWLKISDDKFSWGDLGYQAVLGGITGALFSSPSDISLVRQARSAGAKVYAQGDAAVKNKINEGLIEVKLLKERGLNNDNVQLAEAALAKLTTDENLSQTTKEYYLGLAEQMVLKQNLSDQYNALAKELVAKAKADPSTAQSMADAFNALVNEAGGEGKYTAADFTNENSEAARIYVVAQMANDWLSRSDAEIATDEIMRRKAAIYQGTAEQKNAIRSMQDGSTVAFRVGENAYAVVTKRAGTDTYSVGFTTPGQVESDGTVVATHNLTAEKVEEMLAKPMTEQSIDAEILTRAEANRKAQAQEQAEKPKTKRKRKPKQTTATETAQTEAETRAESEQTEQTEKPIADTEEARSAETEEQKREREREERNRRAEENRRKREEYRKRSAEKISALKKKKNYGLPDSIVARAKEAMERLFGKPEEYHFTVAKSGTVTITSPGMFGFPQKTRYANIDEAIGDIKSKIVQNEYYFDSEEIKSMNINSTVDRYGISKEEFVSNPDLYNAIDLLEHDLMRKPWSLTLEKLQEYKAKKEANRAKQKTDTSLSPAATETAQTEQTTQQEQTAEKVKPEDLSDVEARLTSAFGIDGSEFTKEEWTKARECVPNIDGLTRREQASVLTLVRTAQANGINEDYMKGLARLSSVYGFGVVFEDIDVSGFYSRKNGVVVINPKNLDETFGHEIEHSFDQIVKEGKAEFRTDLSEKVKRIVGASVFEKARAQYKADYEKLRARDGSVAELSDAELEAEATANVVGKYLSNMTLLKKIAATDYSLGRGLLTAIRRIKDKWTSAKAFAKENNSTTFAEYRKMTRIENLLMKELGNKEKVINNSEISYSVSSVKTKSGDLVALHNLSEDRLKKAIELGGFPMPSIAVTKTSLPHTGYGDITVVFGENTIDPEMDARNYVYDRDGWTPTAPKVDVKLAEDKVDNLVSELKKSAGDRYYADRVLSLFDGRFRDYSGEYIVPDYEYNEEKIGQYAYENAGVLAAYLNENGIDTSPVYSERTVNLRYASMPVSEARRLLARVGITQDMDARTTSEEKRAEIRKKFYEYQDETMLEKLNGKESTDKLFTLDQVKKMNDKNRDGSIDTALFWLADDTFSGNQQTVVDNYATLETLQNKVESKEAFYNWIWEKFSKTFEKRGIDNDSDTFDRRGNRRSFEQRHYDYTIENVIRAMKKGEQTGTGVLFGGVSAGSLAAKLSRQFDSISSIREAQNYLARVSEEDMKAFENKTYELFDEVVTEIAGKSGDLMNDMTRRDDVGQILAKCAEASPLTVANIKRVFERETQGYNLNYKFDGEIARKVLSLFQTLENVPTMYFEAKPRRAVGLSEIKMVEIPNTASKELRTLLASNEIPFEVYGETDEQRTRAISNLSDVSFSPAPVSSATDSEGNALSANQQQFFAKSKVRDANGRLLVVYHGTDADFDTFDLSRAGKNGRAEGFGFYFAANQEITKKYGDKQKKVYLNMEKPLYDNRRTVTKAELRKFVNALVDYRAEADGDDWSDTFISDYVYTKNISKSVAVSQTVDMIWSQSENDQNLIYDIANGSGMNYSVDTMEEFYNVLYQSIGYDGNISTWKHDGGTDSIYVTFHPEQAKYVTNTEPTKNTDLRYSPAPVTDATDSDGESLTPEQQEFFKDSKIRITPTEDWHDTLDENGSLFPVYHGTNTGEFYEFSEKAIGSSNDAGWFGRGFYFAFSKAEAGTYGRRILKCYLNIKNPFFFKEQMYGYKGETHEGLRAQVADFILNLSEKFPDIAKADKIYLRENDGTDRKISLYELASEIKDVYESDRLIVEEVAGADEKYWWFYDSERLENLKISKELREALQSFPLQDAYYVEYMHDKGKISDELYDEYTKYIEEHGKNEFERTDLRVPCESMEEAKKYKMLAAVRYLLDRKYDFVDFPNSAHEIIMDNGEQFRSDLETKGYDGVVQSRTGDEVVAFYPEQIKLTSNKNPTANTDIRYSPVTPETDSRYLSLARDPQKNESELRRLVKEAAEKAGYNSPLAYHGTPNRFNVFSKERIGSETDYGWFGKGFYFTTDKDTASIYADHRPDSNIIEAYLKIDNPFLFSEYPNGENMSVGEIMEAVLAKKYGKSEEQMAKRSEDFSKWLKENHYDAAQIWSQIMILDSSQAKRADPVTYDDSGNVIPLSERFNPQNDDIRYSPAPSGSGRIVIQASQSRPTGREKLTNLKGELSRSNFRAALESLQVIAVNAQQGVENQLVRAGLTKREAAAFSQLARSGRSHAINAICYKLADMTGAIRSDGLIPILEPFLATKGEVYPAVDKDGDTVQSTAKGGELAGKRYSEFSDYYAMLHAIDRAAVGKNPYSSMTVAQMKQIVAEYEQKNPDFKAAAEKLSAFNSAMLDIEVQAGIISQETADLWRKQYPHYVPMYTQDSNAVGGKPVRGSRNMEVRRDNAAATESDHRVSDPLRNYIDQVQRRIRAAKLNILLNEVYNSADGVNVVTAEADRAEAKDLRAREQAYLENPESENDPAEMFRKFKRGKSTVNEVSFYKDGKRVTMAVTDRIYTGLSDLGGIHSSILDSWTVKAVKKVNDTFKKLVTNWNPFFAVKNIARDLQDGTLQSRFGMGEFLNMYRKNAEMMATGKYNDMWEEFLANGGLESSLYSDEFGTFTKGGKSGLEQATGVVGQFQHIKNFNTLTEALPRFTEYCLTRKHGGSVQTALLNAADVTVNFGRSGTLIRILNSTVSPFLNPAVQGLDRVIRLFTEDGIKNNKALASLLLKAVLLAIVPMALGNAMYGDDDEYKDMKDSIKENNYLFKVGDTWLKLPRGRVVSTISGLFNRSYKQLSGQDVDWGDYGKNVLDQITPAQNVARHIGSPFYDVANNRTWYGTKIESDALQNYAVNQRYDENTSRVSVWIGQLTSHFGLSPKEVNYLIDQYTGVIGDILLPTTTPAGTKGVVSYNFTVDQNTSSNLSNRFYDLYNKTMYKSNDGDVEAYYLKKRLDETKSAVSELFKQIKTINASSELSNKEKVKQASAIRASINQLYKTALDDRRLYVQNVKDALAIENSYAVEKITAQSAKRYGIDSDAVGKYALTFGGDFVKKYDTEAEANAYKGDASKKTVYAEANRLTYGAEYALREYNVNVYEKAKTLNELGISYDEYYNYYMTARYYSGKTKKDKILAYLNGSGLSKSQIALMMYYSGYSAYADEAKKAIKASSLSAERKKELLAGITN